MPIRRVNTRRKRVSLRQRCNMNRQCKTCVYFDDTMHFCKAHPPKPMDVGGSHWPEVEPLDWCGEWHEVKIVSTDSLCSMCNHDAACPVCAGLKRLLNI